METKIKAIIIEDEQPAQYILQQLIERYCNQVEVVEVFSNLTQVEIFIETNPIDLVFLDIHLGDENGFQFYKRNFSYPFQVIFTTAHAEYAVKAFEVEAVDYILKPIEIESLQRAVSRAVARIQPLKMQVQVNDEEEACLIVSETNSLHKIPWHQLVLLEANRAYTLLYLSDGSKITASKPLKHYQAQLALSSDFIRIHRSFLLNINFLKSYQKKTKSAELQDGRKIPVSPDGKKVLLSKIG